MFLKYFLNIIPPPPKKTHKINQEKTNISMYTYIYLEIDILFLFIYLKPLLAKKPTNKLQTNPEV